MSPVKDEVVAEEWRLSVLMMMVMVLVLPARGLRGYRPEHGGRGGGERRGPASARRLRGVMTL